MHVRTLEQKLVASACLVLLVVACGGDTPTGPGHDGSAQNQPGVHAVLGAGVTDTIDAEPLQALVVEARGPGGKLASGVVVRLEAQRPADTTRKNEIAVSMCPLIQATCGQPSGLYGPPSYGLQAISDTTDANGRVKVIVKLGHVAGQAVIRLTVPEFGLEDSARYTVLPGAAARVHALVADTALAIGATANLRGHVVDRYNNNRAETPTYTAGPGNAITLDAATGDVTGRDMGTQWLFIHFLQAAVDSTSVRVLPPTGRLVVWSSDERAVRLVNLDGSATRTVVTGVSSDLGAFPRFDAARQGITVHNGSEMYGGASNSVIVIDTTGSPRRDIGPSVGFATVIATRELADGTLLVVGRTVSGAPCAGFALYRIAVDNSLTCVVALPGMGSTYGGADISHDGTHVAYIGTDPPALSSSLRVLDVASGATTVLETNASPPRWSSNDDRLAYLVPGPGSYNGIDGTPVIINADGTGRRLLPGFIFSPGLTWSPDGTYLVGRNAESSDIALRVVRVSDGANVLLRFRTPTGSTADYYQPDWR